MTHHLVYLIFAIIALLGSHTYGQSVASAKRPCPGASAKKGDTIHVHYQGYIDKSSAAGQHDKMFDSSLKRGTPFTFKLGAGQVIAGWDKG
jgi:FKBP-type peptidyl-prolyl cis-trans isomerase